MLTGMSVDEVSCRINKKGATGYNNLICLLNAHYHVGNVMMLRGDMFSPYAGHTHLCRVRFPHSTKRYWSHWIIIDDNIVYDPSAERQMQYRSWWNHVSGTGAYITSYVMLTRRLVPPTDASAYLEQLQQLAKRVVWDGDLISKRHRTQLILDGMADRFNGYNFITRKGIEHLTTVGLMPDVTQYRLVKK
jgi:hypothetical protein